MIRRLTTLLLAGVAVLAVPTAAQADFGLEPGSVKIEALNKDGTVDNLAGSHPYSFTLRFGLKTEENGLSEGGEARDAKVDLPPGFFGNPNAVPVCTHQQFEGGSPNCPASTQVGVLRATVTGIGEVVGPVFNVTPPPGYAAELGFASTGFEVRQYFTVDNEKGYGLHVLAPNFPLPPVSVTETVWGTPADSSHDAQRGAAAINGGAPLPSEAPLLPFLTLPTDCAPTAPEARVELDSVQATGLFTGESGPFIDSAGNPAPTKGCESVPFSPRIAASPTSRLATNPSGLDFDLTLPNEGLLGPLNITESEPREVEVALPEGVTLNPSAAEGLAVCSPGQYAAEKVDSTPGAGCPEASKLGSVLARTPLLDEPIEGSLYLATPYENPFGSLLALYMVARGPEHGIFVRQAGEVKPDPVTGQLKTTFSELPPIPYSSFKLHFREGGRAPLVTPPSCGTYEAVGRLTPFSSPGEPATVSSAFQIEKGADGGACPAGGTPPFRPGLIAGSINNAAGRYSPFNVRIFRTDAEQEITHFSIKLPPGVTGKLAGIPFCSDLSIAAAHSRERQPHGGQEELDNPSCPQASEIGHTLVGAGVGGSLTYVPGKIYLAGPYNGDSLSIVAITAAKAGPFDLGTVVVREGLEVNPETAEVFIDATGSDPIPHIINGIPVHLRDVRAYVDRSKFVLNPTNCERTSTASTILGSGTDFSSEADDRPVTVTTPYQAADCASLGYQPRLKLKLKGSTKRGGNPALTAILRPRPGDANSQRVSIALPHSEFLEQGHIKTICTRVQFKAGAGNGTECPAASVYGTAKVWTPLLSEPLTGPIFLRSSEHPLPDLVIALHGLIDFDAVGRIDSVNGGIRNSFETVPDAPIEKVEVKLGGGKKSLLANSVNLCARTHKATAKFAGQNGRNYTATVPLQPKCSKKGPGSKKRQAR
jgi:hypothetical protein